MKEVLKQEGDLAASLIGAGAIDMTSQAIKDFLKENSIKFAEEVNEVTNKKLRKELTDGLDSGEGIGLLAKRVEKVFENAERHRSIAIARTETARAMNFGTIEAYKQSEVVEQKQWLTAFDERTCERCVAMNGKTIGLKNNYFDKGDTFMGLDFSYGEVSYPPLHVRCRCTIIPVFNK